MKKILLLLVIFIGFNACKNKKNRGSENISGPTISKIKMDSTKQEANPTEKQKEEKIRDKINADYLKNLSQCDRNVDAVTDFNGKKEFWRICNLDNGNRIIQIDSHEKTDYYQEVYFEKNNELVYAEESIKYMPVNHYILKTWTCRFYTKNGEIITLMSLGMGKTESEEWDPDEIFAMHTKRLSELKRIAEK